MKWIGQHIYDLVARFRNDVFIENSDLTIYKPINDDPAIINLGSSATERLEITANYASGTQEVNNATFKTYTASTTGNRGRFIFSVDETSILHMWDAGLNLAASKALQINGTNIISDSSGTATLSNIDALDATTEATIESAIDTLSNLTAASSLVTVGTIGTGVWNGTKVTDIYTNSSGKRYGNTIKILPTDFMVNEDILTEPLTFKDAASSGVAISNTASEMIAFIAIPEGMKATALDIYSSNAKTVKIYEIEVDDTFNFNTATANETGAANSQITIDPAIDATAVNYLAIVYVATATTNRIYGGLLTIAAQ